MRLKADIKRGYSRYMSQYRVIFFGNFLQFLYTFCIIVSGNNVLRDMRNTTTMSLITLVKSLWFCLISLALVKHKDRA